MTATTNQQAGVASSFIESRHYQELVLEQLGEHSSSGHNSIIELDLYDPVRKCGCRGAQQFCVQCWELIVTATLFIEDTLVADFGIKKSDIQWFFSGRRGLHVWITDPVFSHLDIENRSAMADYLSLVKNGIVDSLPRSPFFRQRISKLVVKPFLRDQQLLEKACQTPIIARKRVEWDPSFKDLCQRGEFKKK